MSFASWVRSLKSATASSRTTRKHRAFPRPARKLTLEQLEDRLAPATLTVNTTADNATDTSVLSLRDAITLVNHAGDPTSLGQSSMPAGWASQVNTTNPFGSNDTINFAITAASDTGGGYNSAIGVATITPQSALPLIDHPVVINGYSQPGASPNCLLGSPPLGSTDSTLHPCNYGDNAVLKIELDGASSGTHYGLYLNGDNITVQGLAIDHFAPGIFAEGAGEVIQGNFLGTDVSGTVAQGNGGADVVADFNSLVTIGGTTPATRNIISGSTGDGVQLDGGGHVVQGNFIGTDVTGTKSLGNADLGILIDGNAELIGGSVAGAGNVIAGNGSGGVSQSGGSLAVVQGNFIGTDVTGTQPLVGNYLFGLRLGGNATVGGSAAGAGNLFGANGAFGLQLGGNNNAVQGNFFGSDVTGTKLVGNGGSGVVVGSGSNNNTIGGVNTNAPGAPLAGAGNLFANSPLDISSSGNVVEGNYMGTDITGTQLNGGGSNIGLVPGATGNTIGGTTAATRNIIIDFNTAAIGLTDYDPSHPVSSNLIEGNYIGTDVMGTRALGGFIYGIELQSSSGNTIGGTAAGAGNVIAGGSVGISLQVTSQTPGLLSSNNLIQGNRIGTDYTGTELVGNSGRSMGNSNDGIEVAGPYNTIGGTTTGAGNIIAGNGLQQGTGGVTLNYPDNGLLGNSIFQNTGRGVTVGASNNTVGGTAAGAGNVISGNTGDGVLVTNGATGVSILGNSIHDNGGLGIRLDNSTNANNNQAASVLTAVYTTSGATIVIGTITSTPSTTFRVEFFANAAGDPEGRTLLGNLCVTTDSTGHGNFTAVLSAGLSAGQGLVTATATEPGGNTSEFSAGVTATPLPPSSLSGTVFEDFNDDGQVDFGENGIDGVTITLTGTDFLGNPVNLPQPTSGGGAYSFLNLLPGSYYITETQPAGYLQGIDSVGTAGGSLSATDQFLVNLPAGVNGLNYNFGEQLPGSGPVQKGQTAGIGFWNNKNGQALINALPVVTNPDGSVTSVANWLAATLPNMFGANSANDLAGKSNASVAALFQSDFVMKGVKLDAQVLATALSVYATSATLDSTAVAANYGFIVSGDGVGTATWNVGSAGDAFGVANNTTMTVMDLLLATDDQAVNGLLYNGNTAKRNEANAVYSALNQAGSIG